MFCPISWGFKPNQNRVKNPGKVHIYNNTNYQPVLLLLFFSFFNNNQYDKLIFQFERTQLFSLSFFVITIILVSYITIRVFILSLRYNSQFKMIITVFQFKV